MPLYLNDDAINTLNEGVSLEKNLLLEECLVDLFAASLCVFKSGWGELNNLKYEIDNLIKGKSVNIKLNNNEIKEVEILGSDDKAVLALSIDNLRDMVEWVLQDEGDKVKVYNIPVDEAYGLYEALDYFYNAL